MPVQTWKSTSERKLAERDARIPSEWRVPLDKLPSGSVRDVVHFPRDSGLFTARELEITEASAADIVARIAQGQWTSLDVTEAFCKRTAVAQQLINWYGFPTVYRGGTSKLIVQSLGD